MDIWANLVAGLVAFSIGHMAPLPPLEYNHIPKKEIRINFDTALRVHLRCGGSLKELFVDGYQIYACSGVDKDWIIMPDPCYHTDESYARVLCHELGHSNGWPADHPGAIRFETPSTPQSVGKTPPK